MRNVVLSLILALPAVPTLAQTADPNLVRGARGRYLYRTLSEQKERGGEQWRLSVHPDGSRTMRMFVRIADTGVLRDVTYRVDPGFRPKEMYTSLWVKGKPAGSGLYTVTGNRLEAIVNGPHGRLTQEVAVPERFSMVPHPVATDGWHFWYYDEAKGGVQEGSVYNPDTLGAGAGSILGVRQSLPLRLVGREEVTTPAGTFATRHFEMAGAFQIWVAEADAMMVRMTLPAADREYVLVEYEEER